MKAIEVALDTTVRSRRSSPSHSPGGDVRHYWDSNGAGEGIAIDTMKEF